MVGDEPVLLLLAAVVALDDALDHELGLGGELVEFLLEIFIVLLRVEMGSFGRGFLALDHFDCVGVGE